MSWSSGWGPSASTNDSSSAAPRPPRLQGRYDNDNNGSATSSQSPSRSEAVFLNNSRRPSPDRRAMGRGGGNATTTTGLTSSTAEPLMDPTAMPPLTHRNGGWPSGSGGGGAFHTPHPQNYPQHQQLQRSGLPYPTSGYAADPSSMSIGGGGGGSSMLYNPPPAAAGSSIDPTWGADVTRSHQHHHHLHHHHHYAHSSQATNNMMMGTPGPGDAPWWDGRRHEGLKVDNPHNSRQQWPEGPSAGSTRPHAQHNREGGDQLQPGRDEQQQQQQLEHQVYELHQGLLKYRAALQDERRRREAAEARVKELEQRIHLLLATSVAEQQAQLLRGATHATSHPVPAMTPRNGINGYGGAGVVNSSSAGLLSAPSVGAVGVTDTASLLHNVNASAWAPQQQQQLQQQQQQQPQAQLQLMARLDILESQNELLRQRLYENGGQGNGGGGTMATTQKGGGAAGGGAQS